MTARKELLRQYKDTQPAMGVYRVHNTANGRMLIGSSADIRARLREQGGDSGYHGSARARS